MPPAAASHDKTITRHRRKQKNTDVPQHQSKGLIHEVPSRQTKSDLDFPENETEAASTPPAINTTETRPTANFSVSGRVSRSVVDGEKTKKTPKKPRSSIPNGSPHMPKSNGTPRSSQPSVSLTPGKKSTTPSRAYAGPTFHASPAASSLPMPKFYSKSVPDVNRASSMQTVTKEASETSSDQSEDSPTPGFAQRVGEEQVREESPLDFFFKADREQKERQRLEQQVSSGGQHLASGALTPKRPQHHSRHSTSGSQGGLFPMELENREPTKASHEKASSDPTTGISIGDTSETLRSSDIIETPQQAEQRRAKTIALKKLLMSSVPPTTYSTSGKDTVSENTDGESSFTNMGSKQTSNPHLQKHIAAQTAGQVSPCPQPNSNLRKEVFASKLLENESVPELPATPTPSQTRNAHKSLQALQRSPIVTESSPAPPSTIPEAAVNPFKAMEDDLRRILKMNDFSSSGAAGVPS
ncbi:MAG: hypothetical protein Q9209_003205 [Squamulea sp. 1 TL-2023]